MKCPNKERMYKLFQLIFLGVNIIVIVPDAIIKINPNIAMISKLSPKKIPPKILAQTICVYIKGLIILLCFPAIWKAAVQVIVIIIKNRPEKNNNNNSRLEGIIGSNKNKIVETRVKGKKK